MEKHAHHWNLDVVPAVGKKDCGETRVFEAVKFHYNQPTPEAAYEMRHAIRTSKRYAVDW